MLDAAGALRQLLGERLALLDVGAEDDAVLAIQGLADGLAVHVRVAVHVAADPGAKSDDARQLDRLRIDAVQLLQRLGDLLVKVRHHPVQHFTQVEQHMLALIGHRETLTRVILGLPGRGDLGAHPIPDRARFARRQGRIQPVEQQLGYALLLAQHGAPGGFGGMGGEHRLDLQLRQDGHDVIQGEPCGLERAERILDAAGLRPAAVLEEVIAPAANAVHLFRQVHHLEPGRKRAHQIACLRGQAAAHPRRKLPRAGIALAPIDGGDAVLLHRGQQRRAPLLAQDVADEIAQGVDILTQRFMLGRKMDLLAFQNGFSTNANDTARLPRQQHAFGVFQRFGAAVDQHQVALPQARAALRRMAQYPVSADSREGHRGAARRGLPPPSGPPPRRPAE